HLLDVVERSLRRIVVTLEAVLEILSINSDFIDYEPCLLHYSAAVFKCAGYFLSRSFQGAIKTERLGQCWTPEIACLYMANPRIAAIPFFWSIEDLFRALHNP